MKRASQVIGFTEQHFRLGILILGVFYLILVFRERQRRNCGSRVTGWLVLILAQERYGSLIQSRDALLFQKNNRGAPGPVISSRYLPVLAARLMSCSQHHDRT